MRRPAPTTAVGGWGGGGLREAAKAGRGTGAEGARLSLGVRLGGEKVK